MKEFDLVAVCELPIAVPIDCVAQASAVGSLFVCGLRKGTAVYLSQGGRQFFYANGDTMCRTSLDTVKPGDLLVASGPDVFDPKTIRNLCCDAPFARIRVCPLESELPKVGMAVAGNTDTPRVNLGYTPVTLPLPEEATEFDPNLNADAYGRMAHLIGKRGLPVLNQIMWGPCRSWFYGRVLAGRWWGEPVFIMLAEDADSYFPSESVAIRKYAARWVPAQMKNTPDFQKDSQYTSEYVNVMVADESVPMVRTFLLFLRMFGAMRFVVSSDPRLLNPLIMPVFRSNRGYNVSTARYLEITA
jgi:hypothetical protein